MLQINSTLLVQMVNFVMLIWILNRLIFKSILRVAEERRKKTSETLSQALDVEVHTEQLKKRYESDVAESESRGLSERDALIIQGRAQGEKILEEARLTSGDYIANARKELEASLNEVRRELKKLLISFSGEMVSKILGRAVS